jgi:hypothetical protein
MMRDEIEKQVQLTKGYISTKRMRTIFDVKSNKINW